MLIYFLRACYLSAGSSLIASTAGCFSKHEFRRKFIAVCFCTVAVYACPVYSQNEQYLTQSYVDSSVNMAFYGFIAAQEVPDADFMMKRAIADAKDVAARFKRIAKGTLNEKYILWKVSELESQIWLEERELVLKQFKRDETDVNSLIRKFNAELAKSRPDFTMLAGIEERTAALNVNRANAMRSSMMQRSPNVSREVISGLEKAAEAEKIDIARAELRYIRQNMAYLEVGRERFVRLENDVEAMVAAADVTAAVQVFCDKAFKLMNDCLLREASAVLETAKNEIERICSSIPSKKTTEASRLVAMAFASLNAKEDSIVNENLDILRTQGLNAGIEYYRKVTTACGVAHEKAGLVDGAIMAAAPVSVTSADDAAQKEMDGLTQDSGSETLSFDFIRKEARRRADSVASAAAEKARLLAMEKARKDSILTAKRVEAERLISEKRATARSFVDETHAYIEKGKIKQAQKYLNEKRAYIIDNLEIQVVHLLEESIINAKKKPRKKSGRHDEPVLSQPVELVDEREQRNAPVSVTAPAVDARRIIEEIYELLNRGELNAADSSLTASQTVIMSGAPPEVFAMIRESIDQARETLKELRNREIAKEKIAQIYELIEMGEIETAFEKFTSIRDRLEKYAGEEPFQMLEQTLQEYLKTEKPVPFQWEPTEE